MNLTDLKRKYNKALRNAAAALLLALFAAVYLADMFIYQEPLLLAFGAVLVLAVYLLMQRDVWLTQPYINRVPNLSDGGFDIEQLPLEAVAKG